MTQWKTVPVEPTPEMKTAGIAVEVYPESKPEIGALTWAEVKAIYSAMLAAAPQPAGEPVATLTVRDDMGADIKFHQSFTLLLGQTFALYTHPQPDDTALLRQAWGALAYWLEHGETPGAHDMIQRTHDALQERLK